VSEPGQTASSWPRGLIEAMAAAMWTKYGVHRTDSVWIDPVWDPFGSSDAEKAETAKWRGCADVAWDVVQPILDGWKTEVDALNARIAELESAASLSAPRENTEENSHD